MSALLFLIVFSCAASVCAHGGCSRDPSFDYFLIVMQWPASFGAKDLYDWTLHGLWPSRNSHPDTYPCSCSNEKFDVDALASIRGDMEKHWPTLYSGSSVPFWEHEWSKHGTCSGFGCQLDYFNSTLGLRAKYTPLKAFGSVVVASKSRAYSYDTIRSAFKASHGVNPLLGCRMYKGRQELSEVGLCLSKATLLLSGCSAAVSVNRDEVNDCDVSKEIWLPVPRSSGEGSLEGLSSET